MITEFRAQDWRCLRDVTVHLTPLHAFIGPNDSGKSTLLRALCRGVHMSAPEPRGLFRVRTEDMVVTSSSDRPSGAVRVSGGGVTGDEARDALGAAQIVRFDADRLRSASELIPGDTYTLEERGANLPGVYDAILNRDRAAWDAIEASTRAMFPTVRRLGLRAVDKAHKVLEVELQDGTRITADAMSEGLLYWLAFAALPHTSLTKLVLVEEPENGLHPSRIADVMRVLRTMSERGIQVVLATHSPLVVNELRPEEVSVVTRTVEHGTRVRRVSEIPDIDRLLSAFSLGELWLAFADGKEEAQLFQTHGQLG